MENDKVLANGYCKPLSIRIEENVATSFILKAARNL